MPSAAPPLAVASTPPVAAGTARCAARLARSACSAVACTNCAACSWTSCSCHRIGCGADPATASPCIASRGRSPSTRASAALKNDAAETARERAISSSTSEKMAPPRLRSNGCPPLSLGVSAAAGGSRAELGGTIGRRRAIGTVGSMGAVMARPCVAGTR
eukprot:352455-Chlamydomonas_euryale.AAC.1